MNDNYLNIHILFTTGVANMNRDDSGAPKQITIGGTTRNRYSSQAMTRAKRLMFEQTAPGERTTWRAKTGMNDLVLTKLSDLANQSGKPLSDDEQAQAAELIAKEISGLVQNQDKNKRAANERSRKKAEAAASASAAQVEANDEETPTGADISADADAYGPKDTLVWLAEHEVNGLAEKVLAKIRDNVSFDDFIAKKGCTQSLTIAAFGRMFAFRPDLQNEAAIQRSHAFTTHETSIEPDYFTAVDDLPTTAQGAGAGHLDLAQYSSGVYYWHCNIDRRQLWATWIAPNDSNKTRAQLFDLVEALMCALPNGKQATTASKTVPDAVLAVPASAPIALHQAFERPVRASAEGFRQPSVDALLAEHAKIVQFTPRQFPTAAHYAGTVTPTNMFDVISRVSLDDVIDVIVDWILAVRPTSNTTEDN
jgi:CRISPR system Cascade subunit CasC